MSGITARRIPRRGLRTWAVVALAVLALAPLGQAAAPAKLHLVVTGSPSFAPCPDGVSFSTNCEKLAGSAVAGKLGKVSVVVTLVIAPVPHNGWKSTISGTMKTPRGVLALTGNNAKDPKGNLVYAIAVKGSGALAKAKGTGTLDFYGNYLANGNFSLDALVSGL